MIPPSTRNVDAVTNEASSLARNATTSATSSGRPLRLRGVDVIRFDDADCIEENTIYFDGADFARQLGMLPRQNSTADRAMLGLFNTTVRLRNLVRRERGR